MADKSENMEGLAELLPEGLTEHAGDEIAQLVNTVITERVNSEVDGLITKVNAFLRMKVDEIKEYALMELEQDEEVVRNAHLYESMKTIVSMDLGQQDEDTAVATLQEANEESQGTISSLTKEIEKLSAENEKLITLAEALNNKVEVLEEQKEELSREAESLVESQKLPFKSSEQAVMVSKSEEAAITSKEEPQNLNEFLTPEVMRFMPIAE